MSNIYNCQTACVDRPPDIAAVPHLSDRRFASLWDSSTFCSVYRPLSLPLASLWVRRTLSSSAAVERFSSCREACKQRACKRVCLALWADRQKHTRAIHFPTGSRKIVQIHHNNCCVVMVQTCMLRSGGSRRWLCVSTPPLVLVRDTRLAACSRDTPILSTTQQSDLTFGLSTLFT